ncbi:MAG: histidine kinase [Bacteroidota bacterium]
MNATFQKKPNVALHVALWFLYYITLVFIFSRGKTPKTIDYIYAMSFLAAMALPIVLNTYFLVPRFLQKGKYVWFSITFFGIILLFWFCYTHFFEQLINAIFQEYYFISYQTNLQAITKFVLLLLVSMLLKIFESWLYFNAAQQKFLQMENQRIQTRLTQLRAQINPHFLFNSLNVIYALAIEKKEETPNAIVQLSEVLRYIIYEADTDTITLKEELNLLKNYIAFQKFRTHGLENISFTVTVADEDFTLYPMLLLPLVENAFKHGMQQPTKNAFINISLTQKDTVVTFKITNTHHRVATENDMYSGVGLENIRHNLEIVYPKQHQFQVESTAETFTVFLKIHPKQSNK